MQAIRYFMICLNIDVIVNYIIYKKQNFNQR